ncbi:hypothetical protein ACLMJK_008136 [Lecanora helva]
MESRHFPKTLARLAEARCTCRRTFSTRSSHLLPAQQQPPPPPSQPNSNSSPKPPPYSFPKYSSSSNTNGSPSRTKRTSQLSLLESLYSSLPPRQSLDRVAQYDLKQQQLLELEKRHRARDLERQIHRGWKPGDCYSPHDLSGVEMEKWRVRQPGGGKEGRDVFDLLGLEAEGEYKNFAIMSEYMTSMGRIRHRRDTGLRAVNQRKIAKAIRRAVGMGLIPSVHKHPEVLEAEKTAKAMRGVYGRHASRRR